MVLEVTYLLKLTSQFTSHHKLVFCMYVKYMAMSCLIFYTVEFCVVSVDSNLLPTTAIVSRNVMVGGVYQFLVFSYIG